MRLLYLCMRTDQLAHDIVSLATHIHAATQRLLDMIRRFDDARGWELEGRTGSSASRRATRTCSCAVPSAMPVRYRSITKIGYFACGAAVLLLLISPILKKWMHGIK